MAVIIDEFEVISDSQQERSSENNEQEQSAAEPALRPHDIKSVYEQNKLRNLRVWAH